MNSSQFDYTLSYRLYHIDYIVYNIDSMSISNWLHFIVHIICGIWYTVGRNKVHFYWSLQYAKLANYSSRSKWPIRSQKDLSSKRSASSKVCFQRSKYLFTRKGSNWNSIRKASHYVGFWGFPFMAEFQIEPLAPYVNSLLY